MREPSHLPVRADLDTIRLGLPRSGPRLEVEGRPPSDPGDALIAAIVELLDDGPCLVEFSGGCDSSLVLAAAARACSRAGHDPPVPVTARYGALANEQEWQELVVRHLRIDEWRILNFDEGESDILGAAARTMLREHGVVFPATAPARAAFFARAGEGLLLAGEGGDEVLGRRRMTGALLVGRSARHRSPLRLTDVAAAAWDLAPRRARRRHVRESLVQGFQPAWLDDEWARVVIDHLADEVLSEALTTDDFVHRHLRTVRLGTAVTNLRACASSFGVRWEAPLLSGAFAAAIDALPWRQFTGRNDLLHRHFSDWLPERLVWRRSKAAFSDVYFGAPTRAFAAEWDGTGVPAGVRADWLKSHWTTAPVLFSSTGLLLQHLWLQEDGTQRSVDVQPSEIARAMPALETVP